MFPPPNRTMAETNAPSSDNKGAGNKDATFNPEKLVPQLAEHKITELDMRTAIRVLEAVASLNPRRKKKQKNKGKVSNIEENADFNDGIKQYKESNLRPLRKALSLCFDIHKQVMYEGKTENQHYAGQMAERTLKRQKLSESANQQKYIATTALRRGRVEKLEKLKEDAEEEERMKMLSMVPDGHVDTEAITGPFQPMLLEDEKKDAESESKGTGEGSGMAVEGGDTVKLPKLRSCYVCKIRFRDLHHFYDQLCPSCASINFSKRHQTADLSGKVAVVTGSRVKIGYQTCLKLLRAGATVVATTRFPNSSAATYRAERDFEKWGARLHVYGLDLRDVTGLEAFTRFLKARYGEQGIDILINNACQTVRRPSAYYTPMVAKEQTLWKDADALHRSLLDGCIEFERVRRQLVQDHSVKGKRAGRLENGGENDIPLVQLAMDVDQAELCSAAEKDTGCGKSDGEAAPMDLVAVPSAAAAETEQTSVPFEATGLSHSAAMSQMAIVPEDVGVSDSILPPGVSDINGQQLDLRKTNSWLLKMDEVSTPEVMECMFVNAIAPFVLNSRLKPLMTTPGGTDRPNRYVINVSAMEGKFYRYKMPNHPHTNMAKAALNMLTRTSSEDLAKRHRIYMNSVDTGWINDENPLEKASKIAKTNKFQTPIDEIDAAARILDPIFVGITIASNGSHKEYGANSNKMAKGKDYGKFFKDYRESEW